ncbi:sulfurtransferase [Mesobacillus harenae]|uniref:sulfurtransferase n=1 Tax=Mesobacillus harenae TaxID=2213203 RepID=UPI0015803E9A|nr:sulfurtransferase [Mesobacillus harenae]
MKNIVTVEWLKDNLDQPSIRIADCRFELGRPAAGKNAFTEGHIPGSVYFHLEKDLSGPVQEHGGRHPLPNLNNFKDLLEKSGFGSEHTIIAYDQGNGAFAARFYWLLKYMGHKQIVVLNGGLQAWTDSGYSVTKDLHSHPRADFQINLNEDIIASTELVKSSADGKKTEAILIDSREPKRYLGLEEPIDKKAGRIPGALNYPWNDALINGKYKSAEEQLQRFSGVPKELPVIVYCGSGVTAAPNFLALEAAGYKNIKLYIGSFSDWISYPENPVEDGAVDDEKPFE